MKNTIEIFKSQELNDTGYYQDSYSVFIFNKSDLVFSADSLRLDEALKIAGEHNLLGEASLELSKFPIYL